MSREKKYKFPLFNSGNRKQYEEIQNKETDSGREIRKLAKKNLKKSKKK